MNLVDIRRFEMLTRVRDFGLEHADLFPPDSAGGKIFGQLAAAVSSLDQQSVTQYTGTVSTHEGTVTKASKRAALRDTLEAFVITARAIALATAVEGLEDKFRMPPHGDKRMLIAAKGFVKEAGLLKSEFIAHGMAPAFVDDLSAQIADFEAAQQLHAQSRETRVAARYGVDAAIEEGMIASIRLDAVVRNTLSDNGVAMAKWNVARHVEYPGRSHAHRPDPLPGAPAPAAPGTPAAPVQPA